MASHSMFRKYFHKNISIEAGSHDEVQYSTPNETCNKWFQGYKKPLGSPNILTNFEYIFSDGFLYPNRVPFVSCSLFLDFSLK